MNLKEDLEALVHFFNEIVAHVIPGALLLLASSWIFDFYDYFIYGGLHWTILVGASYLVGHAILALNRWTENRLGHKDTNFFNQNVVTEFKKYLVKYSKIGKGDESINLSNELSEFDYRNIAMSIVAEAGILGRRFMFISLFCKGTGTTIFLVYLLSVVGALMNNIVIFSDSNIGLEIVVWIIAFLGALFIINLLEKRASEFYKMAMNAPFSVGIVELIERCKKDGK